MAIVTTPSCTRRGAAETDRPRRGTLRHRLLTSTALALVLLAAPLAPRPAAANPLGGQVVAGSATITTPNASTLDVTQSSPRAAIDWRSFNIAPTQTTNFVQPSASSVTLNRVQAGDPSVIAGHLNANGQVILVNPSGVTFARGAQVNVNSIIATPSDISNSDFMHGRMSFDIPSKDPNARVVNRGRITVAQKGLAALVAPGAANSGVIQAKLGTVVIGGAKTFTVDFYGDGLINFAMTAPVTAVPIGADGKPVTSLVSNSGRIEAAGGTVLMTADAAAGILRNVVDVSGRVDAPTYAQIPGSVTIDAGAENRATVSGRIDVSGYRPGQVGGTAVVTGGSVDLASTARIRARGPAGGGTVMIGFGSHGADAGVPDAQATNVASGAVIDASATGNGGGGNVTVWSDGTTIFNGTILARGGPQGGDGGWVETSGRALSIDANAIVDTAALVPSGKRGTWLLDPTDLDITTATNNTTQSGGNPDTVSVTQPSDSGGAATVSNTAIEAALGTGNVVLTTIGSPASTAGNSTFSGETATGRITVDAPITWNLPNTLTMNAAGDIVINQPIAGTAGTLILNAGGSVGQAAAGTISVSALEVTAVGPVSLGQANAVGTVAGDVTGSGNSFLLSSSVPLTVNTVDAVAGITTTDGNIGLITTAGDLTLSNNVDAGTASMALQSAGGIFQNGSGGITAANLEAVAVDAIALNNYGADAVGTVAGQVTGAGSGPTNSFLLANASISMTVGTVGPIDETSGAQMLGALSGVTTNGGNILLGPNVTGSLTLDAPVNANNGSTILGAAPGQILLQAGNTITQAPGAIVIGSALLAITGGSITLTEANRIGESDSSGVATTAGVIAMAGSSVAFRNDRAGLAIGALDIDGNGGLTSGPVSGITATGGAIMVATTTAGGIEVDHAIASGGGEIDIAAAPGSGITNKSAINSSGGNIVLLGDSLSLGGNTPAGTVGAGAGIVVLGPSTTGDGIALGTTSSSGTLGLQTADFATITAGMVQIGYPGMTGSIDVQGTGISIGTADVPALVLVTGGDVTETAGAIAYTGATPLTLGAIAGGSVDMAQANAAGTLAGYAGGSGSTFAFLDGSALTVGALPLQQLGVTVDGTTGLASSAASTVSTQTGALTGVTTAGGNIVLKTTEGDIDIDQPVNAGTGAIGLSSAGGINQDNTSPDNGGVVGSALDIVSANSVDLAAGGGNTVGSLAASVANSAASFDFRNDGATLTVNTVGAVTAGSLTFAQQSGIVTKGASPGPIDLLVFGTADLILNQPVDANAGSTTTLGANPGQIALAVQAGGISQAATGTIVGSALEFIAGRPATLSPVTTNAVNLAAAPNLLGTSTAPGQLAGNVSGSGGVAFRDTNPNGLETASLSIIETYDGVTTSTNAPNGISLGTTAGPITITNGNGLTSNGGEIDVAAAPGYGITNQGAIASSGGNIVLLGDSLSLGGNGGTVTTGSTTSGTVVLGPSTISLDIGLGNVSSQGSTLGLQTVDLATVTAGMVQIGYPTMTGNITIVGGIAPSTTDFPALALVTGGTISENTGDAITFTTGTLGAIAGGSVTLTQANSVGTVAGFAGGGGTFTFLDDAALIVGSLPQSELAVAVDGTSGVASSAAETTGSFLPTNPLAGITTYSPTMSNPTPGGIILEVTGDLAINQPLDANNGLSGAGSLVSAPGNVGLLASGAITQGAAGVIYASALQAGATGSSAGSVALASAANEIGNRGGAGTAGLVAGNAAGAFSVRDDGYGLTVGSVGVSNGATSLATTTGVATTDSAILLETTTAGDLTLDDPVDAGTAAVTLIAAGTIGQDTASGQITGGSLEAVTLNDAGAPITLDDPTNNVAQVTLSTLNAAHDSATPGGISFVGYESFTVVRPPTPLYTPEIGVETTGTVVLASSLAGGLFTNGAKIDTTGQLMGAAGDDIAILADTMTLAGGTINAGTAGRVLLGPITTTEPITLVGSGGTAVTGDLNLANADLATIGAGVLEIGVPGLAESGDITVGGAVALPSTVPTLLLGTSGTIATADTGTIAVTNLALVAQSVNVTGANAVQTIAGEATAGFAFGDSVATLTIGTVPGSLSFAELGLGGSVPVITNAPMAVGISTIGTITVQNAGNITVAAPVGTLLAGSGNNVVLETTAASGDLTLDAAVSAGTATIGLSSVGTITQNASGSLSAGALEVLSLERVSLGASGGTSASNNVGDLAAQVFNSGESFVYANNGTLIVTSVTPVADAFGATLLDPSTGMASGAISGVTTNNANIGLRAIGGATTDLKLDANVYAGAGDIGLEATRQIVDNGGGFLTAAGLEADAGSVLIADANVGGPVAGRATATGGGFVIDSFVDLTVGTVGPIDEQGSGSTGAQMLGVGALSGVATQNGTIALQATGSVVLDQTVDANGFDPTTLAPSVPLDAATAGSVFLATELGTITQDPTNGAIVAAGLEIDSAARVSLGASGNTSSGAANEVTTLAAIVLAPGESFVFRDDSTSLTVGTLSLGGGPAVDGIQTNDANIGLRVTTSGTLTLAADVNAANGAVSPSGAGVVGLESTGTITQTTGAITASALEVDAVGSGAGHDVSLPDSNVVSTVAAQTEGSFAIGDATSLTVGTVGPILESGTGTPPNPQMLAAGAITGITASGVTLQTTGAGSNLVLSASLSSGAEVMLDSAGSIAEIDGATITAPSLATTSAGGTSLGDTNAVADLLASTNSGSGGFLFVDGQALSVSGPVAGGTQNLTLTAAGPLAVDGALSAGTDIALQGAGIALAANVTGGTASGDTLGLDATSGTLGQSAGAITGGTLGAQSAGGTSLGDTNAVAGLGASTNTGSGGFLLVDGEALTVTGSVAAGSQNLTLTAAGPLSIDAALSAGTDIVLQGAGIVLAANVTGGTASGDTLSLDATSGTLGQSAGTITGGTLGAQSTGGTSLGDTNEVAGLGTSTNTGSGGFLLVDGEGLSVTGPVAAGSQNLTLTAAGPLAVDAALSAGTDVALQGAGIALAANVTGGTDSGDTLGLDATSGTLGQSAGTITGGTLGAQSTGGTSLGDTNEVAGLGTSTNIGSGGFLLVDDEGLSVTGPVGAGSQNLTLTAAGPLAVDAALSAGTDVALQGAGIALAANVTGGTDSGDTLSLDATSGTLGQSAGTITGGTLSAQSTGGTSLGDANAVAGLGTSTNTGSGGFLLIDGEALTVTGPVAAGSQNLALTAAGPLSIDAALSAGTDIALQGAGIALAANVTGGTASGDTLSLDATSGTLGQSAGTITGGTLGAQSTGGTSLGDTNEVAGLGTSTNTGSGGFLLVDGEGLSVTGPVAAGSQNLTLTAAGPLVVDAALSAGTDVALQGAGISLAASVTAGTAFGDGVSLNATSGPIGQSAGVVTGNTLAVVSTGGTSLGDANAVPDLLASTNSGPGGFLFVDGPALSVSGPVAAGTQNLVLVSSGSLTVSAAVTAGGDLSLQGSSVTLAAAATAGTIASVDATSGGADEANGAVVRAPSLIVDAGGAASFGDANAVGILAGEVGGAFEFTDAGGLTIGTAGAQSGVTTAAGDIVIATTAGDLSLAAGVSAGGGGGDVALLASGGTSESGGSVTASGLIVDAGGAVVFGGANRVATLSGTAGRLFEFVDAQALTVGTVGPVAGLAAPANVATGIATDGGAIGLATTTGDLTLAANVDAGGGNTAALIAGGNLAEAGGGVTASGLIAKAGGTVDLDGANAVATLAGLSGGTFRFTAEGGLTIGSVAAPGGAAAATAVFAAQSGVATTGGDVRILAPGGDLVLASGVSAGGGADDAALITAGNASEAGGIVTAAALLVRAGGNVAFATMPNAVGTLSGSATTGTFDFVDGGPLAIAAIPAIVDQPAQSGLSAAGSVLVTSRSALSVAGNITIGAGGGVVLDANGAVTQEGGVLSVTTTAATQPVLAIDTTGLGADTVAARIASGPANANLIALFPPTGADNPMRLADLEAPGYATLLIGGSGAIGGRIDVLQLGVSGSGGSAALTGTVGQQSGKAAARLGVRNPFAEAFYDLNGCVIASDCFTLPSFVPPVEPQPVSELDVLSVLPGIDDIGVPLVEIIDSD